MKVKICGITDRENLSGILSLKPDFTGFIFYPASPRYMADKLSPEDLLIIPANVKRVGVFVNADPYEIEGIFWKYNLDFVQLHGDESPAYCEKLNNSGIPVIKAFRIGPDFIFQNLMGYIPYCRYFLFDTYTEKYGGSGKKFNWEILYKYDIGHPFLLSGGIGPFDAEELKGIGLASMTGIDLNSRFEDQPGIKNIPELRKFLNKYRGI